MKALLGSLVGSVKKGIHPRHVGVAVFLGSLAGFTTGWNLTLVSVLLLALLLRHNWKVFLQSWGVFYALSWLMTPWCYRTGRYLLEGGALGRWLAPHADSLWLALWDLDRYTLLGGVFWGALVGLGTGYLAAALTRTLQAAATRVQQRVEQQPGKAGRLAWRLLCRVVFGSSQVVPAPGSRPRWISWAGVAMFLAVVVPAGVLGYLFLPRMVWYGVNNALWMANGAEVGTQRVQLSLTRGYLQIDQLQVADPDDLQRDQFRVQRIVAVVRPGPLVRGRVVADRVVFDGVQVDVPREIPARAWNMSAPQIDFPELTTSLLPAKKQAGTKERQAAKADEPLDVDAWEEYLQQGQQWKQRLAQLQRWIRTLEQIAGTEQAHETDQSTSVPRSWTAMRQARCRFGRPCPQVWIGQLVLRRLPEKWGLGPEAAVQIVNITSRPELLGKPTRLELLAPECGLELLADFNFHRDDVSHAVALQWQPAEPQKLVRLPEDLPLRASPGRVIVQGQGWFTGKTLQLPLRVRARELSWQTDGEKPWGLDARIWKQALMGIDSLELRCRLQGSWSRPELQVDTEQLLAQLQHQLKAAGYDAVAQVVGENVGRLKKKAQAQLAQAQRRIQQEVENQKAKLQAAQKQAQEQLTQLQQQGQEKLQQSKQALAQATQQAQEQLSQQSEKLKQQATEQAAQLAEQAARSVQKPLDETAQKAKEVTELFQRLQQQTADASQQLNQLNQQAQQTGTKLRQSVQKTRNTLQQLTGALPVPGSGKTGAKNESSQQPQPLVRKNPYVDEPLAEAPKGPSPSKQSAPTAQVFVPESVASPMNAASPLPAEQKPSQAELAAQLGVQVVETPAQRRPSASPQASSPPAEVVADSSPAPASTPPATEPVQFYGDPLAIATDQPQGPTRLAPAPAPYGIPPVQQNRATGTATGLQTATQPGATARNLQVASPAAGKAVAGSPGSDPGARTASFAAKKSPVNKGTSPAAAPQRSGSLGAVGRTWPPVQPNQGALPKMTRQEEKKPLWKRMSQGVSDGFKRLWPFKKKPAPEQTATLPPAQLNPPAPKVPTTRPRLPQLEPPMPVQEAKVPWYKKLFRR